MGGEIDRGAIPNTYSQTESEMVPDAIVEMFPRVKAKWSLSKPRSVSQGDGARATAKGVVL